MDDKFAGVAGRKMQPTTKHRPAIWECMLGTVYAANAAGEVRYFDYKWEDAAEFAGASLERVDPRIAPTRERVRVGDETIARGRRVLWLRRP